MDLSFNSLTGPVPRSLFSSLPSFRELYLNNNAMNGDLSFFEDLPDLMEVIYIPDNAFYGILFFLFFLFLFLTMHRHYPWDCW